MKLNLKAVLPVSVRKASRACHRTLVFQRALRRFKRNPEAAITSHPEILSDLIYGWGNAAWSSDHEYLRACVSHALETRGPILECGSGLTTIVVGLIAHARGLEHWALEHMESWGRRVQKWLRRCRLPSIRLCVKALRDYGAYHWYDPLLQEMPDSFALVICDGPPGFTKGGRYGLVPVMKERLAPGSVVLFDDTSRDEEKAVLERWRQELRAAFETGGVQKPYVRIALK